MIFTNNIFIFIIISEEILAKRRNVNYSYDYNNDNGNTDNIDIPTYEISDTEESPNDSEEKLSNNFNLLHKEFMQTPVSTRDASSQTYPLRFRAALQNEKNKVRQLEMALVTVGNRLKNYENIDTIYALMSRYLSDGLNNMIISHIKQMK